MAIEDFETGYCSFEEYNHGGPPLGEADLVADSNPINMDGLYVVMFSLEATLRRRHQAAKYLGRVTAVQHYDQEFYRVAFTAFDADLQPVVEADTTFRNGYLDGYLTRLINQSKPLRLGKQNVLQAYFKQQPGMNEGDDMEDELQRIIEEDGLPEPPTPQPRSEPLVVMHY